MKAKVLRELLQGVDDDAEVVMPHSNNYDQWYEPVSDVTIEQLAKVSQNSLYHPDHLAFPPIDRVNVIIIQ